MEHGGGRPDLGRQTKNTKIPHCCRRIGEPIGIGADPQGQAVWVCSHPITGIQICR